MGTHAQSRMGTTNERVGIPRDENRESMIRVLGGTGFRIDYVLFVCLFVCLFVGSNTQGKCSCLITSVTMTARTIGAHLSVSLDATRKVSRLV